jgi:hypothetical protein
MLAKMMISPLVIDEAEQQQCPNPHCGVPIMVGQQQCAQCQEAVQLCWYCQAKGRLLARYCRLCCAPLVGRNFSPNTEQNFTPHTKLALRWELNLATLMTAQPLVTGGILILVTVKGQILLIEVATGRVRAELFAGGTVAVTPVVVENLLIVANESQLVAFNLLTAIYGQRAGQVTWVWRQNLPAGARIIQPLIASLTTVWAITQLENQLLILALTSQTGDLQASWTVDATQRRFTAPFLLALSGPTSSSLTLATKVASSTARAEDEINNELLDSKALINIIADLATPPAAAPALATNLSSLTPPGNPQTKGVEGESVEANLGLGVFTSDGVLMIFSACDREVQTYALPMAVDINVRPVVFADKIFIVATNFQINIFNYQAAHQVVAKSSFRDEERVTNPLAISDFATNERANAPQTTDYLSSSAVNTASAAAYSAAVAFPPIVTTDTGIVKALSVSTDTLVATHSGLTLYDHQGQRQWETALDGYALQTPALILDNMMIVADNNATLFGLARLDGQPHWRQRLATPGQIFPLILIATGLVVVTKTGQLKAYQVES